MRAEVRDEAEEEARGAILLQAIAEREGITVERRRRAEAHRGAGGRRATRARSSCAPSWRRTTASTRSSTQIREQKTLDLLISQAKITDGEPAPSLIVTPEQARAEAQPPKPKAKAKGTDP